MAQEGSFGSGESALWQRRVPPAVAWASRIVGGGFIALGIVSLVMRIAGVGIWKLASAWSDLYVLSFGGYLLVMSFAWRARDKKRAIVLMSIAVLFAVIGIAILLTGLHSITEAISGLGVVR